jgi:hypothetical protein
VVLEWDIGGLSVLCSDGRKANGGSVLCWNGILFG